MAQLLTVRLNKADHQPLGFRLQGGTDFGTPLVVQKVNGGSAAERAGLQAGDALIRVNTTDVFKLRHQEAQDAIRAAGTNLELTVQRGGGTWRPSVTPTGSLPRPGSRLGATPTPVTSTSLKANPQASRAFGSGHNNVAKPFGYMNGNSIVNKQYNTPVNMYSDQTIAETLSAQTEVLAGGVLGVNFKKNEKTYDSEKSAVFKVLQEEQNDPEPEVAPAGAAPPVSGLRHVQAPVTRPDAPINNTGGLPPGQNICEECERLITGVFVRIKDKNLHVECFKCSTCGSSLKNQGYYNLNGKLYCDIHAKLIARQNPPAPNLEPVTVPPGSRIPTNTFSTPLPPLATNNYTNGSSSMFSPSSNLSSGPKPFGSSLGSAYSPSSLSPRSAPLSPARPVTAPAPAPAFTPAPAYTPGPPASAPFAPTSAPAAPFAPTNESQTQNGINKMEFKNAAEEKYIRKLAKMALNGYEIGIQRKIKPGDHIQSMANKIQDTVVTKHPLNAENSCSEENNLENTIKSLNKSFDRRINPSESILSIGDKIKDTLTKHHPANNNINNSMSSNINTYSPPPPSILNSPATNFAANNGIPAPPPLPMSKSPIPTFNANTDIPPPSRPPMSNSPIPTFNAHKIATLQPPPLPNTPVPTFNANSEMVPLPPISDSPIPTFNAQSTPIGANFNTIKKPSEFLPKNLNSNFITDKYSNNYDKVGSSGYSSSDDSIKDYLHTLKKKNNSEKSTNVSATNLTQKHENYTPALISDSNCINYMNTLSKKKQFEKNSLSGTNNKTDNIVDSHKNTLSDSITWKRNKAFENFENKENGKNTQEPMDNINDNKQELPKNLYDNTLYSPKLVTTNDTILANNDHKKDIDTNMPNTDKSDNSNNMDNNNTDNIAVKRREKKIDRCDDGRRDSHIIACPLSKMTSGDVTDGHYPVCHKCDKAIKRGPFITALGRIWCPEHFICTNASCRRPLQDIGFVEENGQLYCEYCFEQYIAPACNKCHAKIKGDCLNAIGKHFHPECFNCVYCGKLFVNNQFFLEDGLPYCEADWNELFTTKCFACGFPVEAGDRWVEALNNNYHSQCFNCTVCKKNLEGQSFFAKGGRPFCKTHAR